MDEIVTSDWSKFGYREIDEAKELLTHIKEIDSYGEVKVQFNTHSGYVFLCDEDYNVWMMNGESIERFHSCSECGGEGFIEDFDKDTECEGCKDIITNGVSI